MTDHDRTAAVSNFRRALRAASEFTSSDLTPDAIARRKVQMLAAARADLARHLPPESAAPDSAERAAALGRMALATLEAHDADSVAVINNEWPKLDRALGQQRQHLDAVIRSADRRRLAAVMDRLEDLVAGSADGEGAAAEVAGLVLSRLAELGNANARSAESVAEEAGATAAWRGYLGETIERGEASVSAVSALYRVDPEAHDALVAADPPQPGFDRPALIRRIEFAAPASEGAMR